MKIVCLQDMRRFCFYGVTLRVSLVQRMFHFNNKEVSAMTNVPRSTGIAALLFASMVGGHLQAAPNGPLSAQHVAIDIAGPAHPPRPPAPRTLEEVLAHCAENHGFYSSLTACIDFWAPSIDEEP